MINLENKDAYIKFMLENKLFAVILPEGNTNEITAQKLAEKIPSAAGIAKFETDEGGVMWGVLIDTMKEKLRSEGKIK